MKYNDIPMEILKSNDLKSQLESRGFTENDIDEFVPDAPRIGMVVAVEMSAIKNRLGYADDVFEHPGFTVYYYDLNRVCKGQDRPGGLYIIKCGAGEINAAMATQFLIMRYFVDVVLNFGVAGGLGQDVPLNKVFIIDRIIHHTFDCSELGPAFPAGKHAEYDSSMLVTDRTLVELAEQVTGMPRGVCASGDMFVGSAERRESLRDQFGADVAEMEAAGIFMTADRNGVPSLFIKAVSDTVGTEPGCVMANYELASDLCFRAMHQVIQALYTYAG